jgi:pilus assembly protein CpaF
LVSEAVDVVVHAERGPSGPRITGVVAVEDQITNPEAGQFTATEVFTRRSLNDPLTWTGVIPSRLGTLFGRAGLDLRSILSEGS